MKPAMETPYAPDPIDVHTLVHWVDTLLSEMNVGMFVYHLETRGDSSSLRLVYANHAASDYTSADLAPLIGRTIGEAFPPLLETDLPDRFMQVVQRGVARNVGVFEYSGDTRVSEGYYGVKAFPMPGDCVGVVFENITTRKRLTDLLKKQRDT